MLEHQAEPYYVEELYPVSDTAPNKAYPPIRLVTAQPLHTLRPILCEWMIHLCHDHGFERTTSNRAICFLDDFLRSNSAGITRDNLQSLGAACVLLASKLYSCLRARQAEFKRDRDLAVALARCNPTLANLYGLRHQKLQLEHPFCFRELFYFEEPELARTCLPPIEETGEDQEAYDWELAQNVESINFFETHLKEMHRDSYNEAPEFLRLYFTNFVLLFPNKDQLLTVLDDLYSGDFVLTTPEVALFDQPRHGQPDYSFCALDTTKDVRQRLYRDAIVRLDVYYCVGSYRCIPQSVLAAIIFSDCVLNATGSVAEFLSSCVEPEEQLEDLIYLCTGYQQERLAQYRDHIGNSIVEAHLKVKLELDDSISTAEDPEYYFVKWCALSILSPP